MAVEKAADGLERELGRSPTVDELAARVGLEVEEVLEAREALTARMSTSLSTPVRGQDDDELDLGSRLGEEDDGYAAAEHRATLTSLSRVLTAREREIVRLRFEQDMTQAEIGKLVGLSQMHVSARPARRGREAARGGPRVAPAAAGLGRRRVAVGAPGDEHGEAVVLEQAVGGVEAGVAQPAQVGLDVGAAVVAHPLLRRRSTPRRWRRARAADASCQAR